MPSTSRPPAGPPLVYVDDLERPALTDGDRHHLDRVLRVRPGDLLTFADGSGSWRPGRMGPHLEADGAIETEPDRTNDLTVCFALVKGAKPELVVQKLTEIGIDVIVGFVADRSVVRWDDDKSSKALHRWTAVAREAGMQSRRARLPVVEPVGSFETVAQREGVRADMDGRVMAPNDCCVLIGPEGGWSDRERTAMPSSVALGSHVLRAETAAIVAGSLLARWP